MWSEIIGKKIYVEEAVYNNPVIVFTDTVWRIAERGVEENEEGKSYWVIPDKVYTREEFDTLLQSTSIETQDAVLELADFVFGGNL